VAADWITYDFCLRVGVENEFINGSLTVCRVVVGGKRNSRNMGV
jgi:hypothetical protein